jgi:hypothetical protein
MAQLVLEWERIKACRAVVPPHVVFRVLVSETVLLNIDTGQYHGMDETGSRFFEVLHESADLEAAVEVLLKEFSAPRERIRADLIGYCSDLVDRGLVELEGPPD